MATRKKTARKVSSRAPAPRAFSKPALETLEQVRDYMRFATWMRATELIDGELERQRISRADLAKRLGVSRSAVTQILSGTRNLTLALFADVMLALGLEVHFSTKKATHQPKR